MGRGAAIAEIEQQGTRLVEHLLDSIDPTHGGFGRIPFRIDAAAHQLLWRHYMVTGRPAVGEAVIASLRSIGRSPFADRPCDPTPADTAQLLELLTWVWRQVRCPELRLFAERTATRAAGFASRHPTGDPDECWTPGEVGLTIVALIEAGSVLERRDWLVLARQAFDAIVTDGRFGATACLDDRALMSRAAIRLFEAFGKPRYLELAEAWVTRASEEGAATFDPASITDAALPSGNALMIGVLARLHALTGRPRYVDRAEAIAESLREIVPRAGIAAATAVANAQTFVRLVSIEVSGNPKLAETQALMRAALDCGLPDRLVLGPGAGDPADPSPRALVRVGTCCLSPIIDPARLRDLTAPGRLFLSSSNDATSQFC